MNSLHPEDTAASLERVQKVCTKVSLHEQQNDFAYWQTQPYQVRLAVLEQIRQEYHRWKRETAARLGFAYPDDVDRHIAGFILSLKA